MLPVHAPEDKRAAMAEFLTRANYGMMLGNFEMDYADGEVRFKTSIDCEGGTLVPRMIDNLLTNNLVSMDRFFNGLMAVLFSDRPPAEIVAEVAGAEPEEDDGPDSSDDDDDD